MYYSSEGLPAHHRFSFSFLSGCGNKFLVLNHELVWIVSYGSKLPFQRTLFACLYSKYLTWKAALQF